MFDSAKLKIERADHHIGDLERRLITFTRQNLDASVTHLDDGEMDITFVMLPPSPNIALTIGDAVHNLRAALDHMVWELVGPAYQNKHVQFPMGDKRQTFETTCKGIKTPDPAINDVLKSLEAFPGGKGEFLYIVHLLDRADKHRILTPVTHAPDVDELVLIGDDGEERFPLSKFFGNGKTLREGESLTFSGFPKDSRLAFQNDAKISPHILFGNIEHIEGEAIFPTIRRLRNAVAETVDIVESSIR